MKHSAENREPAPDPKRPDESVEVDGLVLAWGNATAWKARWRDDAVRRHLSRPVGERLREALSLVRR